MAASAMFAVSMAARAILALVIAASLMCAVWMAAVPIFALVIAASAIRACR